MDWHGCITIWHLPGVFICVQRKLLEQYQTRPSISLNLFASEFVSNTVTSTKPYIVIEAVNTCMSCRISGPPVYVAVAMVYKAVY